MEERKGRRKEERGKGGPVMLSVTLCARIASVSLWSLSPSLSLSLAPAPPPLPSLSRTEIDTVFIGFP